MVVATCPQLGSADFFCYQINTQILFLPAKRNLYCDQLHDTHVHLVGLQETRAKQSDISFSYCGRFLCVSSAALKGNYGCELWLNLTLSFFDVYDDFISYEKVRLIVSEPRFLATFVFLKSCKFIAVVAHAPWTTNNNEKLDVCIAWWSHFFNHVAKIAKT